MRIRQLTLLPLLFMACASIIFCTASIAIYAIYSGCSSWDLVGRYVVPLVIALPFLIAAVFTIPAMMLNERKKTAAQGKDERQDIARLATPSDSSSICAIGSYSSWTFGCARHLFLVARCCIHPGRSEIHFSGNWLYFFKSHGSRSHHQIHAASTHSLRVGNWMARRSDHVQDEWRSTCD